ncbi:manganese efflux pump [Candidatus Daviesbacteria bacterium]|nr:manganese efflux pump [Candidatus Daviesbacteria bacterium]MBI4028882.1 manganese efflux pump [Candidatus Blackburnbacteria bacterium]
MAGIFQILLISFSLAIDAFSVSIAGGIKSQTSKIAHALKIALFFGIFQLVMPLIGLLISEAMKHYITTIDHWIAFILLGIIGIKMIHEASKNNDEKKEILDIKTLFILSIATSIDALIVGITLNLFKIPFVISIGIIGVVTFILSFLGFLFGKQIRKLFGKRVEILGGVCLIIIGLKILIEHLIV